MVITQNGEAAAVIQDIASYEATQETLALLKLLAMGNADIEAGRTVPLAEVRQRRVEYPNIRTLTPAADRDLDDIHGYIAERTSVEQADELIDALIDRAEALAMFPERGSVPPELDAVGKRQYRRSSIHPIASFIVGSVTRFSFT
jgi:plasmid stabilization system protein ParE